MAPLEQMIAGLIEVDGGEATQEWGSVKIKEERWMDKGAEDETFL
jgi:hypothetical protein